MRRSHVFLGLIAACAAVEEESQASASTSVAAKADGAACTILDGRDRELDVGLVETIVVDAIGSFALEDYVARTTWCEFHTPLADPKSYPGVRYKADVRKPEDALRASVEAAAVMVRTYALLEAIRVDDHSAKIANGQHRQVVAASHCRGEVPPLFVDAARATAGQVLAYRDESNPTYLRGITTFYRNLRGPRHSPDTATACSFTKAFPPGGGLVPNPTGEKSPSQGSRNNPTNRGSADQEQTMCWGAIGFYPRQILQRMYGKASQIVACGTAQPPKDLLLMANNAPIEDGTYVKVQDLTGRIYHEGAVQEGTIEVDADFGANRILFITDDNDENTTRCLVSEITTTTLLCDVSNSA